MTPENFCYWLQGFFELNQAGSITPEQAGIIKNHLELVFSPSAITHKKKYARNTSRVKFRCWPRKRRCHVLSGI